MMKRDRIRMRPAIATLAAFFIVAAGVRAQQSQQPTQSQTTLKGGVTYTDQSSQTCEEQNQNNPYAGMNPLVCYGVNAPTDTAGKCSLAGMTVLKQEGNTCYYCSPINPPIVGIIVPMDQTGVAEQQGWGCGLDQADACMAICRGGKTFSPLPGTVVAGGGPGLPPTPAPLQGGPPPGYAPMPGPAGGIGYTPGPNPCVTNGYDYCQNGPGARLPAGCSCSHTPAEGGAKAVNRVTTTETGLPPSEETSSQTPIDLSLINQTLTKCLSAKVPYWNGQTLKPQYLQMAQESTPTSAGDSANYGFANQAQVFTQERALALQAQAAHNNEYFKGLSGTALAQAQAKAHATDQSEFVDYMVGWFEYCLYGAGLETTYPDLSLDDPRQYYSLFIRTAVSDPRMSTFNSGYHDGTLAPLPMLPPGGVYFGDPRGAAPSK